MNLTTEGLVLKQQNMAGGRRMIVLFTREYGKISCGTSLAPNGGKGKNGLALRPFTLGRYQLKKQNDAYFLNGAETLQSHFSLGENVDKFFAASGMLEFTDALIEENEPVPQVYGLLVRFLDVLEKRQKSFPLVSLAYQAKVLPETGVCPDLWHCMACGAEVEHPVVFSTREGGVLCADCASEAECQTKDQLQGNAAFDIISMLRYLITCPVERIQKLDAPPEAVEAIRNLLQGYYLHHLELHTLKSEQSNVDVTFQPRKGN